MIIIADSSALVAVATCQALDALDSLFGTVLVPTAVYDEVCAQGKPQASILKAYLSGKVHTIDLSQHKRKRHPASAKVNWKPWHSTRPSQPT